jgi:hypothetical protein
MKWMICLFLFGCASQKEAQQVVIPTPPPSLSYYLEIDTARLSRGAESGQWTVRGMVERHLATEGLVRPGKKEQDTDVLLAELPSPGYALRARISPRPEQYCHLEIDLVDPATGKHVDKAPWWAIHALESTQRGIGTLDAPHRDKITDERFARLHAQAAELAGAGKDPPLTLEEYERVPKRLESRSGSEYYSPPPSVTGAAPDAPAERE